MIADERVVVGVNYDVDIETTFAISWDPPAADDARVDAGPGRPKKTRRRKRRNVYWKLLEEDAAEENGNFTPVE